MFSFDVSNADSREETNSLPIVFLHGLGGWKKCFKKVAPVIAKKTKRKAYAIDARNHGEASRSKEMNFHVLTEDLKDFLDSLNVQKAVIVGHSMGGRIAINFALKYPSRVDALVVVDMTPSNVDSGPRKLIPVLLEIVLKFLQSLPAEMDLEEARRLIFDTLNPFIDKRFINPDKLKMNYDLDMLPMVKKGEAFVPACDIETVKSMLESNFLQQNLPDSNLVFEGDTLFLSGTKSFFDLEKDPSVRKLFPRAVVRKIQGASHLIHYEDPDLFCELVSNFILHRNLHCSKY